MEAPLSHRLRETAHFVDRGHDVAETVPLNVRRDGRQEHAHVRKIKAGSPVHVVSHVAHLLLVELGGVRVRARSSDVVRSRVRRQKEIGVATVHPADRRARVGRVADQIHAKTQGLPVADPVEQPVEPRRAVAAGRQRQVENQILGAQHERDGRVGLRLHQADQRQTEDVVVVGDDVELWFFIGVRRRAVAQLRVERFDRHQRIGPVAAFLRAGDDALGNQLLARRRGERAVARIGPGRPQPRFVAGRIAQDGLNRRAPRPARVGDLDFPPNAVGSRGEGLGHGEGPPIAGAR